MHRARSRSGKYVESEKKAMPNSRGETRPTTKMVVWGRAAGRCQFPNCNKRLDEDLISGNLKDNRAYVAHIIAAAPNGVRGDKILSPKLADDPDNLMLMCDVHHREIDDRKKSSIYTVEALRRMKLEHEERTDRLLSIRTSKASTILQVSSPIGENETAVPFDDCARAVAADQTMASRHPIEIKLRGMRHKDSDPNYYDIEISKLRQRFDSDIRWRFEDGTLEHLSIFALAPIPILMELGRLISDISDATVFMRHREPEPSWAWPNDGPSLDFKVGRPSTIGSKVALKLCVSAAIEDDRIISTIGHDVSIWEIRSLTLGTSALRKQSDLSEFRQLAGRTLDQIKEQHGEDVELSIFPAVPIALAVEFGRVWQPKAHPPFSIFDQVAGVGFAKKHHIASD